MKRNFKIIFLMIIILNLVFVTQVFAKWYFSSNTLSFDIKVIGDNEPPKIIFGETITTINSFTVNLRATDNQSGITKIEFYLKKANDLEYNLYSAKTYVNELSITEEFLVENLGTYGTYSYYIVAKDYAGNIFTTEERNVELEKVVEEIVAPGDKIDIGLIPGRYEILLVGNGGSGDNKNGGGSGAAFHGIIEITSTTIASIKLEKKEDTFGGAALFYFNNDSAPMIKAGVGEDANGILGNGGILEINRDKLNIIEEFISSNGNPGIDKGGKGGISLYPPYGAGGRKKLKEQMDI